MGIADARAALHQLAALEVDVDLAEQLRADGVDDMTVGQAADAVDIAMAALAAIADAQQAQQRANAAAADPDDDGAAAAAQAVADDAAAGAAQLVAEAADAARQALATLERRHGGMADAVAGAGGSTNVAHAGWYDQ